MLQWCLPGLNVDEVAAAVAVAAEEGDEGEMIATFISDWESRLKEGKHSTVVFHSCIIYIFHFRCSSIGQ